MNSNYIICELLKSIAFQARNLIESMQVNSGERLKAPWVDGIGANNFLMQFQFDILDTRFERLEVREVTVLGAAYLAGMVVGFWSDLEKVRSKAVIKRECRPGIETVERNYRYEVWKKAVARASTLGRAGR